MTEYKFTLVYDAYGEDGETHERLKRTQLFAATEMEAFDKAMAILATDDDYYNHHETSVDFPFYSYLLIAETDEQILIR